MAGLGFEPDLMPFTHTEPEMLRCPRNGPHATRTPHPIVLSDPGHYSHLASPTYFATSWMSLGEDAKESDSPAAEGGDWHMGGGQPQGSLPIRACYYLHTVGFRSCS